MDADLINAALDFRSGWRLPGLAIALANACWANMESSIGLTRANYGTVRYFARDPLMPRDDVATVSLDLSSGTDASVIVEALDSERLKQYAAVGLEFYAVGEISDNIISHRLDRALRRLGEVPNAAAAVGALVAILHVLKPVSPEYDVSYSDPLLPFSIFVGIDIEGSQNGELRLAEGILHECMHLQLTLFERVIPMVASAQERLHSPWQQTNRPSQGILHGLYVFRAIQDFYRSLLDMRSCTVEEQKYIVGRIETIEKEVEAVGELSASNDLTREGKRLVATLLAA